TRRHQIKNLFLRHQLNIALRRASSRLRLRGSDRALLAWMTWLWPSLAVYPGWFRSARQSRPLDRAFALLDPLLARPALVVESNDALGRTAHVRHDEVDAGIKFSGMPLDLGDNPPRLGPGSGLIAEIGMEPAHMVRRSSDWGA